MLPVLWLVPFLLLLMWSHLFVYRVRFLASDINHLHDLPLQCNQSYFVFPYFSLPSILVQATLIARPLAYCWL
ncbi:hypothetical protein CPB84DRAFT_1799602 [Gymnopilus junonius]|uniref:Uncharacterized protein n=1 Tax=Gymnopilus junonius TaxID=109634 RepID=A0A9P5TGL7_GYMJU|nr:hypothetical protein CPB84DRAFT_1799602 [Gymnopilus junonius]